jgi:hypothetical protein
MPERLKSGRMKGKGGTHLVARRKFVVTTPKKYEEGDPAPLR